MTTLEALGCHLPVVTWPGEFMRGRHSAAFLRQMGLEQAIARDLNGFVDIAARLGSDSAWRHELKQEVAVRKHRLFNDTSCVAALEAFYSSVVTGQLKASEPR
jgi:predicted O-linked N-acetylglucosamine transferase (SPINDLY family)